VTHLLTVSGRLVDLTTPDPSAISIRDIAHSLARLCRWNGHVKKSPKYPFEIFSVAQHSLMVADEGMDGCPPEFALVALLHDATEAYLGDKSTPVKALSPAFAELERKWALAIGERFGLGAQLADLPPVVKERDARALATERRDLMPPAAWKPEGEPFPYVVDYLHPANAEDAFLNRFDRLTGGKR
jgi:5'-deoxynucleotidase YfbR-like HD superfamily hydrolase